MDKYYKTLGLNTNASLEEIKNAYKKYAKKYHPDRHNNDEFFKERFQEVQDAYHSLISYHKFNNEDKNRPGDEPLIVLFQSDIVEFWGHETITVSWRVEKASTVILTIIEGEEEMLLAGNLPLSGQCSVQTNNSKCSFWIMLRCANSKSEIDKNKSIYIKKKIKENMYEETKFQNVLLYIIAIVFISPLLIFLINLFFN